MSITLQIDDYQSIYYCLEDLNVFLKPEYFSPKVLVGPPMPLWVVYSSFNKSKIAPAEWGMKPNWDKKNQIPRPLTIARAETLHERVSYKTLIRRYRALIPVNGMTVRSSSKNVNNVYRFFKASHVDNKAMALAALYQFNVDGNMQVSLITKSVKIPSLKRTLRVPLLITETDHDAWLSTEKISVIDSILEKNNTSDIDFVETHL